MIAAEKFHNTYSTHLPKQTTDYISNVLQNY